MMVMIDDDDDDQEGSDDDPESDEVQLLRTYQRLRQHMGERTEIDRLVESIDGMYRIEKRYPGEVNYTVKHSAGVALINPEGEWIATLNPPFHSHRTSEFLVQVIRHDNASQHARNE